MDEKITCIKCGNSENTSRYNGPLCLCRDCNHMWEENIDMDFQIGDEVECLMYGAGVITKLDNDEFPIVVRFINGEKHHYTNSGKYFTDANRVLYHKGSINRHESKIVVDPVMPEREYWYNIYLNEDGPFFGASGYGSKEEAVEEIMSDREYITTIQLKRNKP